MTWIDEGFTRIADNLREAIWVVDAAFDDLLYLNPAFEGLLGDPREADRPIEAALLERVHPDDRAGFREWIDAIQSDIDGTDLDAEYGFDCRLGAPDGGTTWIETVGVPIVTDGDLDGFAGVSMDVTEHVENRRALEERVERLDQFASMVSHDLRNPLSVARGRLALYRERGTDADLEEAEAALERIEELTTDLLELARHGTAEGKPVPVSLEAVAAEAWDAIDTRSASLEVDDDVEIHANPGQLRALLENLFRNAVGHGGDRVTVRVEPTDGGFRVEDTGPGIDPGDRARVFEHGFTTGYGGTGVGLTIVKRIAAAHGWRVDAGEGPEGGARFTFRGVEP